ncbi:MAG: DUF4065 domain-containing protein [Oscillospiraceae bacterium]|nr:DUF4065 domain-containing protein [Oscillospiraceae bacterium]
MKSLETYAKLFEYICGSFGESLGKKVVQKLFYFFERKGINLNMKYCIHYYGPYSKRLVNIMYVLESEDFIKIDTSEQTHRISLAQEKVADDVLSADEIDKVNFVIKNFANHTPLQLEALSTIDFIAHTTFNNDYTDSKLVNKFKEIKGSKFSDDEIKKALSELKKLGFIAA